MELPLQHTLTLDRQVHDCSVSAGIWLAIGIHRQFFPDFSAFGLHGDTHITFSISPCHLRMKNPAGHV